MEPKLGHLYQTDKWKYEHSEKRYNYIRDKNGFLYAKGIYPTRIKSEDLPEWYVYV